MVNSCGAYELFTIIFHDKWLVLDTYYNIKHLYYDIVLHTNYNANVDNKLIYKEQMEILCRHQVI